MKVILWMGMSLNGYIAGEDNNEDFISDDCWKAWIETLQKYECVVFGRKTYQNLLSWPKHYIQDLRGIKVIIVSSNKHYELNYDFELVNSPEAALKILENQGFKSVVLTGGSTLNSAFAKLNLIDEVILNVEPIIEGKGIPVFHRDDFELKLDLIEMKQSKGKTIQLHYKVVK